MEGNHPEAFAALTAWTHFGHKRPPDLEHPALGMCPWFRCVSVRQKGPIYCTMTLPKTQDFGQLAGFILLGWIRGGSFSIFG